MKIGSLSIMDSFADSPKISHGEEGFSVEKGGATSMADDRSHVFTIGVRGFR